MNQASPFKRKVILLFIIIIAIIASLIALRIVNNMRFRLIDSSPKGVVFPSSTNEIALIFNKALSGVSPSAEDVSINPNMNFNLSTKDKFLKIKFDTQPSADFTIEIKNITAKNGQNIDLIKKSYTVKYVPYKDLSDYEKQRQVQASDNYSNDYPIISQLPIYSDRYKITYRVPYALPDGSPGRLILFISVLGTDAQINDQNYKNQARQAAVEDIKSRGFNITDFSIRYTNDTEV